MPIANCVVVSKCLSKTDPAQDLVKSWSERSHVSADNMTINLIAGHQQFGNKYKVMAELLLPSLWSRNDISSLQLGLASALTDYFNVTQEDVFVTTSIINSAMVVEAGKEIEW